MSGLRPPLADFDPATVADRLADQLRDVLRRWGRREAVVAVSGGIDSSVVAALCVRAFGPERVLCLRLPEGALSRSSHEASVTLAEVLGTRFVEHDIQPALTALGCYVDQDAALGELFADYEPGWPFKVVRSAPGAVTVFSVELQRPDGTRERRRLSSEQYRLLLSASNMKQRLRTLLSYTWADRLHGIVVGTPNLLEYDQGFFVKGGDGLADVKPIARLYKGQVTALGRWLGLPAAIVERPSTTETFSLEQSQEEFYFGYPLDWMDLLVWAQRQDLQLPEARALTGLPEDVLRTGRAEVERRQQVAAYLHAPAVLLDVEGA